MNEGIKTVIGVLLLVVALAAVYLGVTRALAGDYGVWAIVFVLAVK